ncbi:MULTISPECIES: YadA C-terminal domain-containing protein [Escherichia]|uniref:YadA C-terminal domain-containing protein n=1 Tax=Escherichia TaxID=561 RepID=UPI001ED8DAA1|nr:MULTISPECIES: YadA-like family protein [Escherichia]MCL0881630.1 YadA-like family protein [Escherichia marmotae]MEC9649218.1 YadA-like family protein [Escherichia marmotae]MEC9972879.1 YadA-like family protein [Escherichia marmotae]MEC9986642.1 YadA-like family protein [Escherichia marmotae]MED0057538.1 YadA-like family protein [Escherichia marmotae]
MSQMEIDQKIGRFLERTGNSAATQNYLIAHNYKTTTPQKADDTAASPVQPTSTLNPITNQAQLDRDNGQDTAIQNAQHTANWASLKADDAHHAIMVAQTDIDANKVAIADTRNDVSVVQSDVSTLKGDVVHAQSAADHANINANTALMNGVKLSGAVTENKNNIEQNRNDIAVQQQQLGKTQKTVADTGDVQTAARYQSMIDARQTAATDAQQQQLDTTQKTVSALGDARTSAHYQEMVNARLAAQNDANTRTTAEQKQRIDTLTTNQATQQHIDSVQYGEQIQRLAQDSTQTHEQIDSLTQDVTQTHQQLTNTQKRVADNSQQINSLNNNFSSLKHEVEDNRKEANAGIASAVAIASQPQVKTGDFMMVSAGAGTFNNESAVSVGASFNAGIHTVIKAGVSADTQSDFGAGVGVGYSF